LLDISRHVDLDLPSLFARLSSDALFGAKEGFGISVMIKKAKITRMNKWWKIVNKAKMYKTLYDITRMNFHVSLWTKSPGYVIYCTIDPNLYE